MKPNRQTFSDESHSLITSNFVRFLSYFYFLPFPPQALGRCIRHRRDWGAIIMVDDRFSKISRYLNSLSKWVRSGVVHYSDHLDMMKNLVEFNKVVNLCF